MVDTPLEKPKASITVLVIEDEGLIRMIVTETLTDAGFQVSEAANGREAMEILQSSDEDLRAVILDVGLPDVNGEELIDKIRALKPGIPIIMTTGYDTNELRQRAASDPLLQILTKPYQPEMLTATLHGWGLVT